MKLFNIQSDNLSSLFLYSTIMFANIDYKGIVDYVLKAVLGGMVWFGFKLLQDYYSVKVREKARRELKEQGKHDINNHHEEEDQH